jgi:hypothetical protein
MYREILDYVKAVYPTLYIVSAEEARIASLLETIARELKMNFKTWTVTEGFSDGGEGNGVGNVSNVIDPATAILAAADFENTIVAFINFHFFLSDPTVIQTIKDAIPLCKTNGTTLAFVSARPAIPTELEKDLTVVHWDLPRENELAEVLRKFAEDNNITLSDEDIQMITKAGLGLTIAEFENALALSLVKTKTLNPTVVRDQKAQLVAKTPALRFSTFKGDFSTLAGLENLKNFAKRIVESGKGRGILVLGVPGTGKSHFAQCLGNETNRPTLMLDFGLLMSSYVGETEQRTKEALDIADAMAPCVLFIDEIEKGLAGVSRGAYVGDSGVSQRQGGIFLKWLQDHDSDVFVVATCNDISKLPPEYLRAERWDAVFFVDLPNEQERAAIFEIYRKYYGLADEQVDVDVLKLTENWTGAEIRSLCRLASALNAKLSEASTYIKPVYHVMQEEIEKLREWAKHRAVPASSTAAKTVTTRRKIRR